ncbi:hypothetical protein [Blastococcus sp. SYSU D00813]
MRVRTSREVPPTAAAAPPVVADLSDLLAATGTASVEELAELVDGDCDADLWVEEIDDGVEIGAGTGAIGLLYPFTVADFWATVQEVEDDEIRRWEAAALADE